MTSKPTRDKHGRFLPETPSPNPQGRPPKPRKRPRRFTSGQVTRDVLELLDEPVTVSVKGEKQQMPAIIAIYRKMIQKAADGDWAAINKVVDLREKYVTQRTKVLEGMLMEVERLREYYSERNEEMPDRIFQVVSMASDALQDGEYRAG